MDGPMTWAAEDLTEQSREAFYAAARERHAAAEKADRAAGRLWQIVGCAGLVVGLLGMGAAFDAIQRVPVQQPPGYILVDKTTGAIDQPVAAKDAPELFDEANRQAAIRDFLVACQGYLPQTWRTEGYHACMLMATPAEQKVLAADIGKSASSDYLPTQFPNGWAMPSAFPSIELHGSTGNPPNTTWTYEVRYTRTEVVSGGERQVPYTAWISLQFHPELKMTHADRLDNPYGTQVISFSTVKD